MELLKQQGEIPEGHGKAGPKPPPPPNDYRTIHRTRSAGSHQPQAIALRLSSPAGTAERRHLSLSLHASFLIPSGIRCCVHSEILERNTGRSLMQAVPRPQGETGMLAGREASLRLGRPPRKAGTSASVCGWEGLGALPGERRHRQTGASAWGGKGGRDGQKSALPPFQAAPQRRGNKGPEVLCSGPDFQSGPHLLIWSLHPPSFPCQQGQ